MNDRPAGCNCPYCDEPLFGDLCRPCNVRVSHCPGCGKPVPKNAGKCPECGAACPDSTDQQED